MTGTRTLPVVHGIVGNMKFTVDDGRIPADDMAFFGAFGLPINIYQIDTIHVTMQGMTR